jgi:hypothetical protein
MTLAPRFSWRSLRIFNRRRGRPSFSISLGESDRYSPSELRPAFELARFAAATRRRRSGSMKLPPPLLPPPASSSGPGERRGFLDQFRTRANARVKHKLFDRLEHGYSSAGNVFLS